MTQATHKAYLAASAAQTASAKQYAKATRAYASGGITYDAMIAVYADVQEAYAAYCAACDADEESGQ